MLEIDVPYPTDWGNIEQITVTAIFSVEYHRADQSYIPLLSSTPFASVNSVYFSDPNDVLYILSGLWDRFARGKSDLNIQVFFSSGLTHLLRSPSHCFILVLYLLRSRTIFL